jgi:hypothetical protein
MFKLSKYVVLAMLSGMTLFGASAVSYADEDLKASCTRQAEEDGYTGEDKANAIKACMEEAAGSGDAATQ